MPQELTDLQSQATARGWRRLTNGQGWEIPKLLVQPIVGKDGRFRATNATKAGYCAQCFAPKVADYEDPACCDLTRIEWLCRLVDVEADVEAAVLSHRDARRGYAVVREVHSA